MVAKDEFTETIKDSLTAEDVSMDIFAVRLFCFNYFL